MSATWFRCSRLSRPADKLAGTWCCTCLACTMSLNSLGTGYCRKRTAAVGGFCSI